MILFRSWTFLLMMLLSPFLALGQRAERINKKQAKTWKGTIIFNDDTELKSEFTYNPLIPEGLIFVKTDSTTAVYGVTQVKSFSFFDDESNTERFFYNLPLHYSYGGAPLGKYFFELIYPDSRISILGRFAVKYKTKPSLMYGQKTKLVFDLYEKYLLDHRDHTIYRMTKKELLRMTSDKEEDVYEFVRSNKLTLNQQNYNEYISVIRYYKALSAN